MARCTACGATMGDDDGAAKTSHLLRHKRDGRPFELVPYYQKGGRMPTGIAWLWPGRLALGKLTLLDGDPDVGKSLIGLDNALRVVKGEDHWPEGRSNFETAPAPAIIFTREDDWSDTILPRLLAAGATDDDLDLIYHNPVEFSIPSNLDALAECIGDLGARYLVLDPLEAYVDADHDTNSSQDTRQALDPFAEFIQSAKVAVWAVRHTNKRENARALDKGSGSRQLGAVARINLMAGRNPNNGAYRVLAPVKGNLFGNVPSLSYFTPTRTVDVQDPMSGQMVGREFPIVHWDGATTVTADQVVAGPRKPSVATLARDAIVDVLTAADDRTMPSNDLEAAILAAGHSSKAYDDGRKLLGAQLVTKQREDERWYVTLTE